MLDKANIVFITHSTGGIVTRQMLVTHSDLFKNKRVGLLLYASPSTGSKDANRLSLLAEITKNEMGQELQWNHPYLENLDAEFKNLVNDDTIPGLIGQEYLENHFVIKWFMSFEKKELVEKGSGGRYFGEPLRLPDTDHFSAVKPYGERHPAHRYLQNFYRDVFLKKQHPACLTPPLFKLHFRVADNPALSVQPRFDAKPPVRLNLMFKQDEPKTNEFEPIEIARQLLPDPHYREAIRLPCIDHAFQGQFTRLASNSVLDKKFGYAPTRICFLRSDAPVHSGKVALECIEGIGCRPDKKRNEIIAQQCLAKKSNVRAPTRAWYHLLISPAHAQRTDDQSVMPRWIVPSLKTLNKMADAERPGFTEFAIRSKKLKDLDVADAVSHAVTVNDIPVLIDGWPAHEVRSRFEASKGLDLQFAMQNLGFTGAHKGRERLAIDLRFWSGDKVVLKVRLDRWYTALRNAGPQTVKIGYAGIATWSGTYRGPLHPDKYEIFLKSSKDIDTLQNYKDSFDELGFRFRDRPVVAVLRPKLPPNEWHGVVLGLRLPTGQIRFTYDRKLADAVCHWALAERAKPAYRQYIRHDIYRFENQPRAPGVPKFIPCQDIR